MSLPHPESQPHNQGSVLLGSAQSLLGHGEWGSYTKVFLAAQGSELLFASHLAAQLTQCLICQGSF